MTDFKFYKFVEDFRPSGTLARECNYLGEIYDPTSTARRIKAGFNRPAGARADYFGLCYRGTFYWGKCPDLSCDEADATLDIGTPPEATIGELYEHDVTWTDLENVQAIGLPTGFTFTIDGETGTISGTPFEPAVVPGEYTITITGTTTENGCVLTQAYNLIVNPCDVADAFIDIGELPDAEEFEPYAHEITFDDVEDIEITGLPDEITATIDEPGGTITLEADELPATGVYQVVVRGTTIPNGCTIEVEFLLRILPCDAGDSAIIGTGGAWEYGRDGACYVGQYATAQIIIIDATDATVSDLPDWLDYEVIPQGDTLILLIAGTPPTGTCGIPAGTLTGWTPYFDTGWYYRDVEVSATTLENECTIRKSIRLFLIVGATCPSPTDYSTLESEVGFFTPQTSPGEFPVGVESTTIFNWNLGTYPIINRGVENLPANLTFSPAGPGVSIYGEPVSGQEGTYAVTVYGTVDGGPHDGCRVEFTFSLVIS